MKSAKELLETIKDHEAVQKCPQCDKALDSVALVSIVYTFEPCSCEAAKYTHLVETLWHRECFAFHERAAKPGDGK